MPRNMSFALTTTQILAQTKTVTRRLGWEFLKPGDELNAVKKCMGFKKGEKIERLAIIRIVSVRREPLNAITVEDVAAEGFAAHPQVRGFPSAFVDYFCAANRNCTPQTEVTRIEFEYISRPGPDGEPS